MKKKRLYDSIFKATVFFFALITVLAVVLIGVYVFVAGAPSILEVGIPEFLLGSEWDSSASPPKYGILPFILSSIFATLIAIIIAVPISLLVALCIGQMMPQKLASVLRSTINMLAGIPSVIYGFVGLIVLVPFIQYLFNLPAGLTMLAAIIVLIVMSLPTIIAVSETSINSAATLHLEASLALGVEKEYALFTIVIPAARSGIMAAILLGVGRAIGETMAVIMVAGNVAQMPQLLKPVRYLTTAIVTEMSYASEQTRGVLIGIGLVLFVFIFIINGTFRFFINKAGKI